MNDDPLYEEEITDGTTTLRGTVFAGIAMIALEPNEGLLRQETIRLTVLDLERLANLCDQMRYALLDVTTQGAAA